VADLDARADPTKRPKQEPEPLAFPASDGKLLDHVATGRIHGAATCLPDPQSGHPDVKGALRTSGKC